MAFMRKAMVFLGLDDEEMEDYDSYDEAAVAAQPPRRYPSDALEPAAGERSMTGDRMAPSERRPASERVPTGERMPVGDRPLAGIRPLPRENVSETGGSVRITPNPPAVRPLSAVATARTHIVVATRFGDAQEIGERFKNQTPVIVNLKEADGPLSRRMIDFCSGVTYALSGTMEKVADHVFLLSPEHVDVPAEERRRLHDMGFYDS